MFYCLYVRLFVRVYFRRRMTNVNLRVLVQMITAHESLSADAALVLLFSGVSPQVTLQFVRPTEPPAAVQPVADERPVPRVPAQVRLQMRRLAVHLSASGDVAVVVCAGPVSRRVGLRDREGGVT